MDQATREFVRKGLGPLLPVVLKSRGWLHSQSLVRRALTSNYRSGKVAFGERNNYRVQWNWITIDRANADISLDLNTCTAVPLPDASKEIIYSSHMVEHLQPEGRRHFVREAFRILKSGGGIRIEAPDAELLAKSYREHGDVIERLRREWEESLVKGLGMTSEYGELHIALIGSLASYMTPNGTIPVLASRKEVDDKLNALSLDQFCAWCASLLTAEQLFSGGHVDGITPAKLRSELEAAGFVNVHADFSQFERPHRAYYSLYPEADKP